MWLPVCLCGCLFVRVLAVLVSLFACIGLFDCVLCVVLFCCCSRVNAFCNVYEMCVCLKSWLCVCGLYC